MYLSSLLQGESPSEAEAALGGSEAGRAIRPHGDGAHPAKGLGKAGVQDREHLVTLIIHWKIGQVSSTFLHVSCLQIAKFTL